MDGWTDRWIDGWMNGWTGVYVFVLWGVCVCVSVYPLLCVCSCLCLCVYPSVYVPPDVNVPIWKTQKWPQDFKMSVFISITKKDNAKECSNYCITALISHARILIRLKIFQSRLQQYVN